MRSSICVYMRIVLVTRRYMQLIMLKISEAVQLGNEPLGVRHEHATGKWKFLKWSRSELKS